MTVQNKLLGTVAALAVIEGCLLGWMIYQRKPAAVEAPAPASVQADGTTVVEKVVDPKAKPKQMIPKGATVTRIDQVTVQPFASYAANGLMNGLPRVGGEAPAGATPCPPVTVDLTQVRMETGQTRVIASSPDGTIIGAKDIIVEQPQSTRIPEHHVTGGYNGTGYLLGYSQKVIGPVDVGMIATFEPLKTEKFRGYLTVVASW